MKTGSLITILLCCLPLHADFQYQSTARMTGGTLLQFMRFIPGSGKLREPQVSTVAVKGNRLVHKGALQTSIIDLDKRTITTINLEKRSYSVMTFDQMKQVLEDMNAKMHQQPAPADAPNISLDADIKKTGQTRNIAGYDTKEAILTMSMNMTDPRTGQSGAMQMKMDMWIGPDIEGYGEIRDFYRRMGKEIDWAPGGFAMLNRPDIARAMAKMVTQGGAVEGTPIEETMKIGGTADTGAGAAPASASAPQSQPSAPSPSVSNAIAGALGGRFGGFGGFGRKKSSDASAAAQDNAAPAPASGSLIEMTIDNSNFSAAPVDDAMFEIPAGFREVPPDIARAQR